MSVVFRRINGRVIPIKVDESGDRAARNNYQKSGTAATAVGGTMVSAGAIASPIRRLGKKLNRFGERSQSQMAIKVGQSLGRAARRVTRFKVGVVGFGISAIGGSLLSYGARKRRKETLAIRDESVLRNL